MDDDIRKEIVGKWKVRYTRKKHQQYRSKSFANSFNNLNPILANKISFTLNTYNKDLGSFQYLTSLRRQKSKGKSLSIGNTNIQVLTTSNFYLPNFKDRALAA